MRRADWPVQLIARGVCAAYWFHPLVWVAWRQLCLEAERACDDAVVGGATRKENADRMDYAEQLVLLAKRLSTAPARPTVAMANRSDLSARVSALLDPDQRRGRAGTAFVSAVVAAAAVVVLALAPVRTVAASRLGAAVVPAQEAGAPRERVPQRRPSRLDRQLYRAAERGNVERIAELLDAGPM